MRLSMRTGWVMSWMGVLVVGTSGVAMGGVDVKMNSDAAGSVQNEVSLALNLNPLPAVGVTGGHVNLLAAYNDFGGAGGLGISYSIDSGATWIERTIGTGIIDPFTGVTPLSFVFDPITASDTLGNVFAGYIAASNIGGPSGLYIENSTDGGNTWSGPMLVHAEDASANVPPGTYRFNDKPHLVADTYAGSARQDDLYAVWIQDDGTNPPTDLRFSASTNAGATWFATPATINDNPGTDLANGPNLTIAPNGDVYVAWLNVDVTNNAPGPKAGAIYIDRSTDGGVTWGADTLARNVSTLPNHLATLNNQASQDDARSRGFPVIEADPTDATGQTLYLTWAEDPDGTISGDEADIYFMRSLNGGTTWSTPLRVNNDATINDQFAPWMDVKADGTIDIAWYDKRLAPNDDAWDVFIASSTDGGLSFGPNVRLTDVTFATTLSGGEPWLGEYLGLVVDSTTAYTGFVRRGDANGDVYFDSIFNSALLIPEPGALGLLAVMLALFRSARR